MTGYVAQKSTGSSASSSISETPSATAETLIESSAAAPSPTYSTTTYSDGSATSTFVYTTRPIVSSATVRSLRSRRLTSRILRRSTLAATLLALSPAMYPSWLPLRLLPPLRHPHQAPPLHLSPSVTLPRSTCISFTVAESTLRSRRSQVELQSCLCQLRQTDRPSLTSRRLEQSSVSSPSAF